MNSEVNAAARKALAGAKNMIIEGFDIQIIIKLAGLKTIRNGAN